LKSFHEERYINLARRFKNLYEVKPAFYCRAPGRVNIIGEHIDYCGYSVLPAAIEQDMIMAYVATDDEQIVINNIDKDCYPTETISIDAFQKFKEDAHWINYFLCGYKAILALDSPLKDKVKKPRGMKILIDSNVPAAAGLSSSSAFCVCTAITSLHANGLLD
jgi:N-acetylgalactosamine kinase